MRFLDRRGRIKWPSVDYYKTGGPGNIKALSVQDLDRLMGLAAEQPWSALGRPSWFHRERDNIQELMLVALNVEQPSVYRCMVTAILKDRSGCRFTLDIGFSEFNRLPDITFNILVTLAHRYLAGFPLLKLDPDQEETWLRPGNRE